MLLFVLLDSDAVALKVTSSEPCVCKLCATFVPFLHLLYVDGYYVLYDVPMEETIRPQN